MRSQFVAIAVLGTVALSAASAAAEVTVASGELAPGTSGLVSLAVSTDRLDAATSRVEVRLPVDRAFSAVAAGVKPGWVASLTRSSTEHVTSVVWTAQSDASVVRPGSFETFALQLGPVPADVDLLTLSTVQTYTDGLTVETPALSIPVSQEVTTQTVAATAAVAEDSAAVVEEEDNATRVAAGLAIGGLFLLLGVGAARVANRKAGADPA